jgi:hypothetical protein
VACEFFNSGVQNASTLDIISGSLSQSSKYAICIDILNGGRIYWSSNYGETFDQITQPTYNGTTLSISNCQSCAVSPDGSRVIITTKMVSGVAQSWTGTYTTGVLTLSWVFIPLSTSTNGVAYSISNVSFDKTSTSTTMGAIGYSPELAGFVTTSNSAKKTYTSKSTL